jgi:hypothetical protein
VKDNDPELLLADVDARIDEIAERVRTLAPDLTLQPVRDAIDRVKEVLEGIDLAQVIEPVQSVFDQIGEALDRYSPSQLVAPLQQRIDAIRTALLEQIAFERWAESLNELQTRGLSLLELASPERLEPPLLAAFGEASSLLAQFPALDSNRGLGTLVAGLLGVTGLRLYPTSFTPVRGWIGGVAGAQALSQRSAALAASIAATRRATQAVDLDTTVPGIGAAVSTLRQAVQALAARLPADAADRAVLLALAPRLDIGIAFGGLDANRTRLLASLDGAAQRAGALALTGFSEVDEGLGRFRAGLQPLVPAGRQALALAAAIGLQPDEISVRGVVSALLRELPPERLAALPMPLFEALRGRLQALLTAVLAPLLEAIEDLRSLIDAIDLSPLDEAADGIVGEVKDQIGLLAPTALLQAPMASFTALRTAFVDNDPLEAVQQIVENLRELVASVLEKLSLQSLLESPLAIYHHIVEQLEAIDPRGLLDPVFDQLDQIAQQVDSGLDATVSSFKRLQDALPAGGGGSTVSVNGTPVLA